MNYDLSICIPVYNGASSIERLVDCIFHELSRLKVEVVLVNDASPDDSEAACLRAAAKNPDVRFIGLRKNVGEHNAVMCALNFARGEYVAIIDDDFQNPPQEILKLLEKAKEGYDVVFSKYHSKKHHPFRNAGSWFNNLVATFLLEKPYDLYLSSFKLIRGEVVREIVRYKGPFPYIDGLILRVTGAYASVFVEHKAREAGRSSYTLRKLVRLWLNMFVNFSAKPLRMIALVGSVVFLCSLLGIVGVFLEKLMNPAKSVGWSSLMCVMLLFFGLQSIFLGLIGEYLGKLYLDNNGTPQWVIKSARNVPDDRIQSL